VPAVTSSRDVSLIWLARLPITLERTPQEATMNATFQLAIPEKRTAPSTMRALVFQGPNHIEIKEVAVPRPGPGEAVILVCR
jgi:hypothetical protein